MISITFAATNSSWGICTQVTVDVSTHPTIVYYHVNSNKILSATIPPNETQVTFDQLIKQGDIITCNYYRNRAISPYSNKLVVPNIGVVNQYSKSFLSKILSATDIIVNNWSNNVFQKLYKGKILARYVSRRNSQESDSDFTAFWTTLTEFLGYYAGAANKISSLQEMEIYLRAFLLQRNIFVTEQEDVAQLQHLTHNLYKELSNRGTMDQFKADETVFVRGEFLRAIAHQFYDELIVVQHSNNRIGWNIGNNSPLYRGVSGSSLNKVVQLQDLSVVGTIAESVVDNQKQWVIDSSNYLSYEQGSNKMIVVDENVDYQITFQIKTSGQVTVGLDLFDAFKKLIDQPLSAVNGTSTNFFLNNVSINTNNKFIFLRCILYRKNTVSNVKSTTSLGGNNLTLFSGVNFVSLIIESTSQAIIQNLEIKPLYTDYSSGFIQADNIVSLWLNNRSELDADNLKQRLADYLFPYHTYIVLNDLKQLPIAPNECDGIQAPLFISTNFTRCRTNSSGRTGDVERLYIDSNPCTNQSAEWRLSVDETISCAPCFAINTIIADIVDTRTTIPFFSYNNNLWRTKRVVTKANGNCGTVSTTSYEDRLDGVDPIWQNKGEVYCDQQAPCLSNATNINSIWTIIGTGNCLEGTTFPFKFYIEPDSSNFDVATIQMNLVQIL